jgi:hypothetical protein
MITNPECSYFVQSSTYQCVRILPKTAHFSVSVFCPKQRISVCGLQYRAVWMLTTASGEYLGVRESKIWRLTAKVLIRSNAHSPDVIWYCSIAPTPNESSVFTSTASELKPTLSKSSKTAQSVQWLGCRPDNQGIVVRFLAGQETSLFA